MLNKLLDKITIQVSENRKYQYTLFFGVFALLFLIMLFFYPLHEGHDIQSHYGRLNALYQAIKDGVFPVYFDQSMVNGYGFATRYFYGDLVLLPFALLIPYIGIISAYKVMMIFYSLLCGLLTFVSTDKVFKNKYIAFISTILFTFSYYRLYDVYNRAAVGETICLTFFPLILWGAYEIIKGDYRKWYIIAIGFTMMIFAHVNTPAIVAFTLIIFLLFNYKAFVKEPKRLYYLILAGGVTIIFTAYFIFPLFEQLLSNEFYFNTDNGKRLTSNVIFGEPVKYIIRGLFSGPTYVVPEIAGIGIVITMIICSRIFIFKDDEVKRADIYLIIGIICLFIISPFYPWRTFPFNIIGFIQFSWRFYAVATFIFCIAAAVYYYKALKTEKRRYIAGIPFLFILTVIVIVNMGQVFTNERPISKVIKPSLENEYFLYGGDYMPSKIPNINTFFDERANDSIRSVKGNTEISNFDRSLRTISFDINVINDDKLELPLVYYKGYKADLINYQPNSKNNISSVEITQSENGLIEIPVSQSGHVKVYFGGTFIQKISPYISLIAIILLTAYIIWFNRKNKKANGR